jgi:ATP-dependent Clp protease ATP-binding subunit ClpC
VHRRAPPASQDGAVTSGAPAPAGTDGFSDVARQAVRAAEAEARSLGHATVGTEHLLLGLLASDGAGAAVALRDAGVTLAAARHKVAEAVGGTGTPSNSDEPLATTSRAGRALGRAVRFSHQARAGAVATSHVLLGVLDVEGRAGQVLRGLSVDVNALRASLADVDDAARPPRRAPAPGPAAPAPAVPVASGRRSAPTATCPSCGAELVHGLTYRVVKARSEGLRTRDALLYTCGACGVVLGAAPG